MNITVERKFWLVVAATVTVIASAVAAGVFGVNYLQSNWRVLADARAELETLEMRKHDIDTSFATLQHLEREQDLIRSAFADPADPLPFIERLEDLGRQSTVSLTKQIVSEAAGTQYAISATGLFPNVMSFMRKLESFPFLTEPGDVSLQRVGVSGSPGDAASIHLDMTVRVVKP